MWGCRFYAEVSFVDGATALVAFAALVNSVDVAVDALVVVPPIASTVVDVAPKPCEKRSYPQSPYCFQIGSPRKAYHLSRSSRSLLTVPLQFSHSSRFFPSEPALLHR